MVMLMGYGISLNTRCLICAINKLMKHETRITEVKLMEAPYNLIIFGSPSLFFYRIKILVGLIMIDADFYH